MLLLLCTFWLLCIPCEFVFCEGAEAHEPRKLWAGLPFALLVLLECCGESQFLWEESRYKQLKHLFPGDDILVVIGWMLMFLGTLNGD